MNDTFTFTSESVTEGHPDKMADQISDSILDALLAQDPMSRVACETLVTTGMALVTGEITTEEAYVDIPGIVRETICRIGYDKPSFGFDGNTCGVMIAIDEQSNDIAEGVNSSVEARSGIAKDEWDSFGAGDQGLMFGYATNETPNFMPQPLDLAHRLAKQLTEIRRSGVVPYLRPDGKTQVTMDYEGGKPVRLRNVVVSTQHNAGVDRSHQIEPDLIEHVIRPIVPEEFQDDAYDVHVNPSGRFVIGGPVGDAGLTGRKIIVDTYGGMARHGGGAFSGKDPSKVDRSAAYAARHLAKNIVFHKLADECLVRVSYAIGKAEPYELTVNTFDTSNVKENVIKDFVNKFDMKPGAIIERLDLINVNYRIDTLFSHFGHDDRNWEKIENI